MVRWWRQHCRAQTRVSYRTSDGKIFVPTLKHGEVHIGAAEPQAHFNLHVSGEEFEFVQALKLILCSINCNCWEQRGDIQLMSKTF